MLRPRGRDGTPGVARDPQAPTAACTGTEPAPTVASAPRPPLVSPMKAHSDMTLTLTWVDTGGWAVILCLETRDDGATCVAPFP